MGDEPETRATDDRPDPERAGAGRGDGGRARAGTERGYALREHTADVAVEAWGPTLGAVVAATADGLAAACCDPLPTEDGPRFAVSVTAPDREALLFDYLDRLIYERDVRAVLPVDNEATVTPPGADPDGDPDPSTPEGVGYRLEATARGVPLAAIRDRAREVKAVTYSEMALDRDPETGRWRAYVVFDV
jgi:SHS2 domain-containing protein